MGNINNMIDNKTQLHFTIRKIRDMFDPIQDNDTKIISTSDFTKTQTDITNDNPGYRVIKQEIY